MVTRSRKQPASGSRSQRRLHRELRAIRNCHQTLLRAADEQSLLDEICRIICDDAGYRLAWVGFAENDVAKSVRPAAWAGIDTDYVSNAKLSWSEDDERGRGPTGMAIRSSEIVYVQDFATDPRVAPWREGALAHGYRSSIALPLKDENQLAYGCLQVYSGAVNAFTSEEIRLLEDLSDDLSFGIIALRTRARHDRAEEALRRSDANLREAQRIAHIGSWELDLEHDALTWSDETYRIFETDPREFGATYRAYLETVHPDDRTSVDRAYTESLKTGAPYDVVHRLLMRDGRVKYVQARWETFYDDDGKPLRSVGTVQDVTQRKQSEDALQESEQRMTALNRIAKVFLTTPDEGMYAAVLAVILELMDSPVGLFGYIAPDGSLVTPSLKGDIWDSCRVPGKTVVFSPSSWSEAFGERVIRGKDIVLFEGSFQTPDGHIDIDRLLATPVVFNSATIGVIAVANRSTTYSDNDRALLESVAAFIAPVLDARLRRDQRKAERDRALDALAESELRYREVFESSADSIFLIDVTSDDRFKFGTLNPAAEKTIGMSRAEASGKFVDETLPQPLADQWIANYRKCIAAGTTIVLDREFDLPSGHHYFHTRLTPVGDSSGEIRRIVGVARDITNQKSAELALTNSERRLISVLDSISDGFFTLDHDWRYSYLNVNAGRLVGRSSSDLLGKKIWDEFPSAIESSFYDAYQKAMAGERASFEAHFEETDAWYGGTAYPFDGGITVIFQNISERKHLEEELRRLAAAIEQSAESIVITDPEGAIEYVNPAFTQVTGYSREEVSGQNPRILKSGQHPPAFYEELWGNLKQGHVWHGHLVNKRKDGTIFEEDATISPVRDERGSVTNYVAVKRDVTQEVALEAQLRHAQKLEAVGRLAGGIAHDFNNLLQAMSSHTQLLKIAPERTEGDLEDLEAEIRRGAALARQLLLFSRKEQALREAIDLNGVMQDTGTLLRRLVRENVAVVIDSSERPIVVEADRGQLEQVLLNLAINAADAMTEGGRLTLSCGASETEAWFSVKDTGSGIPLEIRDKIFDPFFTTKAAGHGTGLGLSVVHGIVAEHGGRIDLDSSVGVGSTFRVVLPCATCAEATKAVAREREQISLDGHGEHVLVVEDDPSVREGLIQILLCLGYEVTDAATSEDACHLPEATGFDILLTDLMLPDDDGITLAGRLLERWPEMKIVLMSGYSESEILERSKKMGHVEFLHKPFELEDLARALERALNRPASHSG